jgi:hypothetical protein
MSTDTTGTGTGTGTELLTFPRYALAGNATFTLQSLKTQRHITFHVIKSRDGERFWVNGPNRERLGWILSCNHRFDAYDKAIRDNESYVTAFGWCWHHREAPDGRFLFLPSSKCCRCGRRLTTPESIALGIGPECLEALENEG